MDSSSRDTAASESVGAAALPETNLKSEFASESHAYGRLSSTVEQGQVKFKLDSPGPKPLDLNALSAIGCSSMDTNDSESFVVLGKCSLDSIRASSMASHPKIQQKSTSVDYSSMIASLSPVEIEHKLSELMQENVRLKETLMQNNLAMKQQFNTLAIWQEEVVKVHQNHKVKFAETRDLINQLRRENTDLKMKLTVKNQRDFEMKDLKMQLQQGLSRESELEERVSSLTKELTNCKANHTSWELPMNVEGNTGSSDERTSQSQLSRINRSGHRTFEPDFTSSDVSEKERTIDFSLVPRSMPRDTRVSKGTRNCERMEEEVDRLQKLVESLERQLRTINENSFAPIQLNERCPGGTAPFQDSIQLLRNVKEYDEKLRELAKCYAERSSRYTGIQKCLEECMILLRNCDKTIPSRSYDEKAPSTKHVGEDTCSARARTKLLEGKLRECRAKLIDEQVTTTSEMQSLIRIQNQLEKIFSDYNSSLYELEIVREENSKLGAIQSQNSAAREALERITGIEERVKKDMESLEQDRNNLEQEKTNFLEEKKSVDDLRNNLEAERKSLIEERLSLDQQNKLYEAERRSLLTEKKMLQRTNDQLLVKLASREEELRSKDATVKNLDAEIEQLGQTVEKVSVLEIQIEIYQNDFKEEKSARQMAVLEIDKLVQQLREVQQCNKSLLRKVDELTGQSVRTAKDSTIDQSSQQTQLPVNEGGAVYEMVTAFSCPKCGKSFVDVDPLQTHVEECLNLH